MKPIFSRNKDYKKNAFLNWRMESSEILNTMNMAEGYLKSAILLLNKCLEDNEHKEADIIIFPVLTCFNHSIELYLKAFIVTLNGLLGNNLKAERTHNIQQLFQTFNARVKDLDGQKEANQLLHHFKDLSSYIDELFFRIEATPSNDKMDFSRYPYTKQAVNQFYVDKWMNIEVDLENLLDLSLKLEKKFSAFSDHLYYTKGIEEI